MTDGEFTRVQHDVALAAISGNAERFAHAVRMVLRRRTRVSGEITGQSNGGGGDNVPRAEEHNEEAPQQRNRPGREGAKECPAWPASERRGGGSGRHDAQLRGRRRNQPKLYTTRTVEREDSRLRVEMSNVKGKQCYY